MVRPGSTTPTSRFKDEFGQQSGVQSGYQRSTSTEFDKGFIVRNLKPYKKYGLNTNLAAIAGMSDTEKYNQAADAVVAKYKAGLKPQKVPAAPGPKTDETPAPRRRTGSGVPRTRPQPKPRPKAAPKPKVERVTPREIKRRLGKGKPPKVIMPRAPIKKPVTKPPTTRRLPGGIYQY